MNWQARHGFGLILPLWDVSHSEEEARPVALALRQVAGTGGQPKVKRTPRGARDAHGTLTYGSLAVALRRAAGGQLLITEGWGDTLVACGYAARERGVGAVGLFSANDALAVAVAVVERIYANRLVGIAEPLECGLVLQSGDDVSSGACHEMGSLIAAALLRVRLMEPQRQEADE